MICIYFFSCELGRQGMPHQAHLLLIQSAWKPNCEREYEQYCASFKLALRCCVDSIKNNWEPMEVCSQLVQHWRCYYTCFTLFTSWIYYFRVWVAILAIWWAPGLLFFYHHLALTYSGKVTKAFPKTPIFYSIYEMAVKTVRVLVEVGHFNPICNTN